MAEAAVEVELVRATARAAVGTTAVGRSLKDFLTVADGRAVGMPATDALASLIARCPDWDKVQRLAEFHGTTPLLEQQLAHLPEGIVPASVQQALRDRCRDIAAKNLLLTSRLIEAVAALEQAGIRVLAIKGPTLAILGYGSLNLRQFNDIDLLVSPADFDRGLEALRDMGYEFAHRITPSQRVYSVRVNCQLSLRDAQGVLVELHTRLMDAAYHLPLEFDALWTRRQAVVIHDHAVSTLADEDLLLYAAVHGTKHGWPCLEWVVDLAQLATRNRTSDWPGLLRGATALHCRRILLLSLWMAWETLGLELPAPLSRGCVADRVAVHLADERSQRLLSANHFESGFRTARFQLRSRERLRDGIAALWKNIFSAQERDWQVFNLPDGWEFLYPIARPLRLLLKYARLSSAHGRS